MKNRIKKAFRFIKDLSIHFARDFSAYFRKGWQANLTGAYANAFLRSLIFYLNQFRIYLYTGGIELHHIKDDKIKKLQKSVFGLHALLPEDARFSYSILIPVKSPSLQLFQECLESALNQSAPHLEILIGLMQPPSEELDNFLKETCKEQKNRVKIFHFFETLTKEQVINQLAENSAGNYLLILQEEDWIRPDFLFRYEQTLRIFQEPEKFILYCSLNQLSDKGYFLPNSEYHPPKEFSFPFFFKTCIHTGWLIPAFLWKHIGGLSADYQGAEYEHLLFQLDLLGATFQSIPLNLYSMRASSINENKCHSQESFLKALKDYSQEKGLNWKCLPGYQENSVRAIPPIPNHSIQVIIPYKDQKELTLKCVQSLINQKDVHLKITAVDNRSTDPTIAQEITQLGGEVLKVDEPFNYSRLNNLAVKNTKTASDCDVLLFLNNDVELEPDALGEMLRWIDQPSVGIVGCRLHYPDGRLQHGGVNINWHGREEMRWEHVEKLRHFEEMNVTKDLRFFDAVTAACAMMKRKTFLEIGGFDEIWYPIGYSDTHLAVKISHQGLKCFYTPYAVGIHHESISRQGSIEDFENSWWLHHLLMNHSQFKGRSIDFLRN